MIRPVAVILAATAAGLAMVATPDSTSATSASTRVTAPATTPAASTQPQVDPPVRAPQVARTAGVRPLVGVRIVLDPGHQLGNTRFPAQITRLVPAGGFDKPCNTTGTETNGGYPEATLNFAVVRDVQARLERLGATVLLTRNVNSRNAWGPCVDARGRFGAAVRADLMVSVHGDGAGSRGRGFHVIAPAVRDPWTTDIGAASRRLALALRAGFDAAGVPRSNYVNRGTGLNVRWDLATLNLSDVPVAMVEVGNMRNASDARLMTSSAGRARYAAALVSGIRGFLRR